MKSWPLTAEPSLTPTSETQSLELTDHGIDLRDCLLSLIVFLPAVGALVLAFFPREQDRRDQAVLAGRSRRSCFC